MKYSRLLWLLLLIFPILAQAHPGHMSHDATLTLIDIAIIVGCVVCLILYKKI